MAPGGVYKSEIQKARNALLAEGKHLSVDAVRVAPGAIQVRKRRSIGTSRNWRPRTPLALAVSFRFSDVLADLVSRLASRLNEEADATVTEASARFEAQKKDQSDRLEQTRQEGASTRTQQQRTNTALHEERTQHDATRQALLETTMQLRQLEKRIAGLTVRLAEQESHARSLEEKHVHARDALEHYRASDQEQREQEQRRHEHQVQGLQLERRQAHEALTAKNQDVLTLNRDNARLAEQLQQRDIALHGARPKWLRASYFEDAGDAEFLCNSCRLAWERTLCATGAATGHAHQPCAPIT